MTTAIDSNVIAGLWSSDDPLNEVAVQVLGNLITHEKLVVSGPVYSELMAGPSRDEACLNQFFADPGVEVDRSLEEQVWREAGRAYLSYSQRRKKESGGESPRRILADFLIGAHALVRGYSLLTIDYRHFEAAFPSLSIIPV